jgi:hypothetical protein
MNFNRLFLSAQQICKHSNVLAQHPFMIIIDHWIKFYDSLPLCNDQSIWYLRIIADKSVYLPPKIYKSSRQLSARSIKARYF